MAVVLAGLNVASAVFAPVAFALFFIALLWPLQSWLEARLPRVLALAISMLLLVTTITGFAALIVVAFGRVGRWSIANLARFQALYERTASWLEAQGVAVSSLWTEHFNISWFVGLMQTFTGQVNTTLTFWLFVLVYVVLGLLEVKATAEKFRSLANRDLAHVLLRGSAETAEKLRTYMLVRTLMSVLTGVLVWLAAVLAGLPLARECGVIAFVLNYIPFLGPLVATLIPTALAIAQLDSWQAVVTIFIGLNVIQFVVGSYIEPRLSGNALAISPFVVLFSVFLWMFLWGIPGAFIGVPISVAVVTFCAQSASTGWLAVVLGRADGGKA